MRLLFWLGLMLLIVLAIKKKLQPPSVPKTAEQSHEAAVDKDTKVETMVCCAHCQVYLPLSEAIRRGEQIYCSKEHAELV